MAWIKSWEGRERVVYREASMRPPQPDVSAQELIDIVRYGGPVPVSQWRRPARGQICAQCGKPILEGRSTTDGISVWHVGLSCPKSGPGAPRPGMFYFPESAAAPSARPAFSLTF